MSNVKLSDRAKKCLTWLVAICTLFVCTALCVRACQRNMDIDVHASRNRVTIQFDKPGTSVTPKKSK